MTACYCGSGVDFSSCCEPIIAGEPANTAESLVRARYTAFYLRNLDFIEQSHAPEVRDEFNRAEAERIAEEVKLHSLTIHSASENGCTAQVDFIVRVYKDSRIIARASSSNFRRENGSWYYISSKAAAHIASTKVIKIGRNDPCHCESGKKYKKCCGVSVSSHHEQTF